MTAVVTPRLLHAPPITERLCDIHRLVFGTGAAAWIAFVAIGFYLTQLSGFKGEKEWKREYPNIIPMATACGVIGFFL